MNSIKNIVDSILTEWTNHDGKYTYNAMNLIKLFRKYSLNAIGERVMAFKLSEQMKNTSLNMHHQTKNELKEWQDKTLEDFF